MTIIDHVSRLSVPQAVASLVAAYIFYGIGLCIYRLYLSPLSKFPGPKLAAATLWYEFYYDVIKKGRFAWEIKRMHQVYGPVVRINPHEIHVNDHEFVDELYTGHSRKRDKYAWSADLFDTPHSSFSTIDHDLHRELRAPLAPYFSLQAIRKFDPVIRDKLAILCSRLEEYSQSGEPVYLDAAFTAWTTDIITAYAFGVSYGYLEDPKFKQEWVRQLFLLSSSSALQKQMPWIRTIMTKLPQSLLMKLNPEIGCSMLFINLIRTRLHDIQSSPTPPEKSSSHPTIMHEILTTNPSVYAAHPRRFQSEGQVLIGAGTITVAHYLKTTLYHILANPAVLTRLRDELAAAIPDPSAPLPPFAALEKLPYLGAVVTEGYRTSYGVIQRLPRIAPTEDLCAKGWRIPAGTPISMSSWLLHDDPEAFPQPEMFRPERWLEPGAEGKKRYLLNFSRGSRACLGKDLARAEIVYALVELVGRFGDRMGLWGTGCGVEVVHDYFNPFGREGEGVRVLIDPPR